MAALVLSKGEIRPVGQSKDSNMLHFGVVAQEVVGTDDSALQAVIAADAELMALREEEAQIQARLGGLGLDDAPAPSSTTAAPSSPADAPSAAAAAAPNGKAAAARQRGDDAEDLEGDEDEEDEDEDEEDDEEDEEEEQGEEQHRVKEPERRKGEAAPPPEASTSAAADADGDRLAEIYERLAVRWLPSSLMRMLHLADTALPAS